MNGKKVSSTAKGLKLGQMAILTRAVSQEIRSMVKASLNGLTVAPIQGNLGKIKCMAMEPTSGPMEEFSPEIGKKTRRKAQESKPGQMVELIQANS